ncbi:MAG: BamA/TamA family outer membrane protein [Bacteroidota bacterium]
MKLHFFLKNINKYRSYVFISFILALFINYSCSPTKHIPENEFLLNKYRLSCDDNKIDSEELDSYIKQKPNRRLLGMFRFHLGIYNLCHSKKTGKLRSKIAEIAGEEPVIYDEFLKNKSVNQLGVYLKNKGYYEAIVNDTVIQKRKKVKINYSIIAKTPYRFNQFKYKIEDQLVENFVLKDTLNRILKKDNLFDVDLLQSERERITQLLKNEGYYYFTKEYIFYEIDSSLNTHYVNIAINIKNFTKKLGESSSIEVPHQIYSISNVYYYTDYNQKLALKDGNNYLKQFDTLNIDGINFLYIKKSKINPKVLLQSNYILPGRIYTNTDVNQTYNHLIGLKNFKTVNIQFTEPINTKKFLDCIVQLSQLKCQSYTIDLEGTNSSGNFGVAGSFKYQHKSLFKKAEIFDFKVRGGMEKQTTLQKDAQDENLQEFLPFNTIETGGELSLNIPKFWFLGGSRNYEFTKKHDPKTQIITSYSFQRRPKYTRTIANISFGYYWQGTKYVKHTINPFEVNFVDIPQIDTAFLTDMTNPYLINSYKNYLITSTNYTLVFNNQDIKKRKNFSYLRFNFEPAGNFLSTINKLTKTTNEGGSYMVMDRKYAQYTKSDFDFRYYQILSGTNKLVFRFFAGAGVPYGNSTSIPFVKQYYSGGANGIRAWPVRALGPGSYNDTTGGTFNYQTADMKLEMNLEYRFKWFWLIEGALFADAGNIWALSKLDNREGGLFNPVTFYNDIAIGSGFGLRFDFSFFVFRFDFGVKVRDPIQEKGNKYVIFTKNLNFFDDLFSNVNVGIGYPF